MIKKIILCADDFGYNDYVSSGIINLLNFNSINATSCMVNMPACQTQMSRLKSEVTANIDVGLHLNFTEGKPLTDCQTLTDSNGDFKNLNSILIKSHLRQLNYQMIHLEIKSQVERFLQYYDAKPDFIDGHQHVHQFPTIRNALLAVYKELNLEQNKTYIRSVKNMKGVSGFKTKIIQATGSSQLYSRITKQHIPTNTNFSGAYDFSKVNNFRNIILNAYKNIENKGLIMCHPGLSSDQDDLLKNSRIKEYAYFASEMAIDDLKDSNIELGCGKYIL